MALSSSQIGQLYSDGRYFHQHSVAFLLAAGKALAEIKGALPHGEWLLWLKEHQSELGFEIRTAQRLLRLANTSSTTPMTDEQALQISRQVWGNEQELVPTPPSEFSGHYKRITGFTDWLEKHSAAEVPDAELIDLQPRIARIRTWLDELDGKAKRLTLRLAS